MALYGWWLLASIVDAHFSQCERFGLVLQSGIDHPPDDGSVIAGLVDRDHLGFHPAGRIADDGTAGLGRLVGVIAELAVGRLDALEERKREVALAAFEKAQGELAAVLQDAEGLAVLFHADDHQRRLKRDL